MCAAPEGHGWEQRGHKEVKRQRSKRGQRGKNCPTLCRVHLVTACALEVCKLQSATTILSSSVLFNTWCQIVLLSCKHLFFSGIILSRSSHTRSFFRFSGNHVRNLRTWSLIVDGRTLSNKTLCQSDPLAIAKPLLKPCKMSKIQDIKTSSPSSNFKFQVLSKIVSSYNKPPL